MFKLVVLSVVLAVAAANPSGVWGAGLATPLAAGWGAPWAAGVATPWAVGAATPWAAGAATPWAAGVATPWAAGVATPWSGAIAAPLAAPVSTVAVHGNGHLIKKRSILAAPLAATPVVATPLTWGRSWVGPAAPLAVAAPVAPWGLGLGARVGHLW